MVDNTDNAMAQILCWVMQPSQLPILPTPATGPTKALQFDWNWARWQLTGRIIAGKARRGASAKGDASFRVLRASRTDAEGPRSKGVDTDDPIYAGSYVAITTGAVGDVINQSGANIGLKEASIIWFGYVTGYDGEVVAGTEDSFGTMTAKEVGHLLDKMQVVGWSRRRDGSYPEAMTAPPTANIAGIDEQVIGNAVSDTASDGSSVYTFARRPSECGSNPATEPTKYWTRWRLLRHLVKICKPPGLPPLKLNTQDSPVVEEIDPIVTNTMPGFLNDIGSGKPEVFNLVEPTFSGQLDLLAPRSLALGWRIDIGRTFWRIVIYSHADSTTYGLPANAAVDVDLTADENTVSFGIRVSSEELPDELVFEGGRIVWGGTASFYDNTLTIGWSASQLAAWKTAASAGTGYAALSTANKKIRNRAVRHGPSLRDVYTRFVPNPNINGDLDILTPPGDGTGTGRVPLVPNVTFDDATGLIRADAVPGGSTSRCPYLPSASLGRTLPWPEGMKGDGTDLRDAEAKALPQYLQPRVFRYLSTDSVHKWRDLEADNGSSDFYPVQVDVDSHGAAMRITTTPVEALAKSHYSGAAVSDTDPTTDSKAIDYTYLVLSFAIESDQRISWPIRRPGVTTVRFTKKITDERFKCWAVHKGTILGIKDDGTPDRVSVTNDSNNLAQFTRNDFPALVKRAKQIAAFIFRSRTAVTIARSRPDAPPSWMTIGQMIGKVVEVQPDDGVTEISTDSYTVIEDITFEFGRNARVTASTSLPDAPTFGGSSSSASSGGAVSVAGEGTVPQRVQRLEGERDTVARPMIVAPKGGTGVVSISTALIIGGNTLASGQTGIKYSATPITDVPSAYDPDVTSSFIDGIGRATLFIDGISQSTKVLIVNDLTGGAINFALLANDVVVVFTPRTLTVGGDPNTTVTAYSPQFL